MAETQKLPFVITVTAALLGLILFTIILYVGRDVLMPLALAAFLAILLDPFVRFMERRRIPRVVAISIAVTITILVVAGIILFFTAELASFSQSLPQLEEKLSHHLKNLQAYIAEHFDIQESRQIDLLKRGVSGAMQNSGAFLGGTLLAMTTLTILLFLVPVYVFLILYYRNIFTEFSYRLVTRGNRQKVRTILQNTGGIVQQYLVGRLIETVIVSALNTIALLLLGIDYAVLFGVLAGLLNLIPYIGVFMGGLFPTLMALITKDSPMYALGVLGAFTVVQFLDNHVILPVVVGGRVQVNSIVAIAAVIAGGQLWGVVGMVLSIPVAAIIKVIFDQLEPLKPWGLLLGDSIPERSEKNTQGST